MQNSVHQVPTHKRNVVMLVGDPQRTCLYEAIIEGCKQFGIEHHAHWDTRNDPKLRMITPLAKRSIFAFTFGARPELAEVRRRLIHEEGVPLLVAELGYINRATYGKLPEGYFQAGWGGLHNLPDAKEVKHRLCRYDELGFERIINNWTACRLQRGSSLNKIVLLGQVPEDAQHNLKSEELGRWYADAVERATLWLGGTARSRAFTWVFRQHPKAQAFIPDFTASTQHVRICNADGITLQEGLADAAFVISYNSTALVEVIRMGIPFMCHDQSIYAPLAGRTPKAPRTRSAFLNRLAWGQWSYEEFANGEALKYLFWRARHRITLPVKVSLNPGVPPKRLTQQP